MALRIASRLLHLSEGDLFAALQQGNAVVRDALQGEAAKAEKQSQQKQLEERFALQCQRHGLPEPVRQLRFAAKAVLPEPLLGKDKTKLGRDWRFDFCWPKYMVAVELQGLVMRRLAGEMVVRGGHATPKGMREDMAKGAAAELLGWHVLCFEQGMVKSSGAIEITTALLRMHGFVPEMREKPF